MFCTFINFCTKIFLDTTFALKLSILNFDVKVFSIFSFSIRTKAIIQEKNRNEETICSTKIFVLNVHNNIKDYKIL